MYNRKFSVSLVDSVKMARDSLAGGIKTTPVFKRTFFIASRATVEDKFESVKIESEESEMNSADGVGLFL